MKSTKSVRALLRQTCIGYLYHKIKSKTTTPDSQGNEAALIDEIISKLRGRVCETFVEFGFSGWEYNCANLPETWSGLLLDGDASNVRIARIINRRNLVAETKWLTLSNIEQTVSDWLKGRKLGILSVDIDGNDYWFVQELLPIKPTLIIVEYNSSLGLNDVSIPYDEGFNRTTAHNTWTYFGASLTAMHRLMSSSGYDLIKISDTGVNAFFIRSDMNEGCFRALTPADAFQPKKFEDGSTPEQQWKLIQDMPFVWFD